MGEDKDKEAGVSTGLGEIRHCPYTFRKLDSREISNHDENSTDVHGAYLMFSWSVLMISESLRPSMISSKTHKRTSGSTQSANLPTFCPTIFAIVDPLGYLEQFRCQWIPVAAAHYADLLEHRKLAPTPASSGVSLHWATILPGTNQYDANVHLGCSEGALAFSPMVDSV